MTRSRESRAGGVKQWSKVITLTVWLWLRFGSHLSRPCQYWYKAVYMHHFIITIIIGTFDSSVQRSIQYKKPQYFKNTFCPSNTSLWMEKNLYKLCNAMQDKSISRIGGWKILYLESSFLAYLKCPSLVHLSHLHYWKF